LLALVYDFIEVSFLFVKFDLFGFFSLRLFLFIQMRWIWCVLIQWSSRLWKK